jgi:hypothetical protein
MPRELGQDLPEMDSPVLDLHHEKHVYALQRDGIDVQEITCQDPGRLGRRKLPPRRRHLARRRPEPGGGQDPADRPLFDPVPEPDHLALDTAAAPPRLLPGQLLNELPHLI